jgi:predicted transglutaminase-like cysteine proteinase
LPGKLQYQMKSLPRSVAVTKKTDHHIIALINRRNSNQIRGHHLGPPQSDRGTVALLDSRKAQMKVRNAAPASAYLRLPLFLLGVGLATVSLAASADPQKPAAGLYMPAGAATEVPYGWAEFCRRYAGECGGGLTPPRDVDLTPEELKMIERVNKWVNSHVKPVSDMEHWGVIDQWDYPYDGTGDCEDYALFKRKILIDEGLPRQALLMTVVRDEHNEGHAVLTVKSDGGDFVLDNLNDDVKLWNKTGYRFVKRQSQTDQNVWVQIGDPAAAPDYVSRRRNRLGLLAPRGEATAALAE